MRRAGEGGFPIPISDASHNSPESSPTIPSPETSNTRGSRVRRTPTWMANYIVNGEDTDADLNHSKLAALVPNPSNYEEGAKILEWPQPMDSKINSIEKNGTWIITELLEGAKSIGVKWDETTGEERKSETTVVRPIGSRRRAGEYAFVGKDKQRNHGVVQGQAAVRAVAARRGGGDKA
ncbi:hypothetical protein V2J09_004010 [Rumex salicifolius]